MPTCYSHSRGSQATALPRRATKASAAARPTVKAAGACPMRRRAPTRVRAARSAATCRGRGICSTAHGLLIARRPGSTRWTTRGTLRRTMWNASGAPPTRGPLESRVMRDHGLQVLPRGGQLAAWHRVLHRLASGRKVRVIVLGGSMAAGNDCWDGGAATATPAVCSWSGRFVAWLQRRFGADAVRCENLAIGGTTTAAILPMLPELLRTKAAHLVLVDFTVNDLYMQRRLVDITRARPHLGRTTLGRLGRPVEAPCCLLVDVCDYVHAAGGRTPTTPPSSAASASPMRGPPPRASPAPHGRPSG